MTLIWANCIEENCDPTVYGTGPYTLNGATTGIGQRPFSAVCSTGDTFRGRMVDTVTGDYVTGLWSYNSATNQITLVTIEDSSNSGAAVSFASGNARKITMAATAAVVSAVSGFNLFLWGDGSDGDFIITGTTPASGPFGGSAGGLFLTRDAYFRDLSLTGTGSINLSGYRLFVSGILDISAAGAGALYRTSSVHNGASVSNNVATGGSPIGVVNAGTVMGVIPAGTAGGTGTVTTGASGGNIAVQAAAVSFGNGAAGGPGGQGVSVGGNAGSQNTVTSFGSWRRFDPNVLKGIIQPVTGQSGTGGGCGGGDGTTAGVGGGGGGANGGFIWISARTVNRSGSTAAGVFRAAGRDGGKGGTATTGNRGGGGGGGAGAGGAIFLHYGFLTGTMVTNALEASGGVGGDGGNGFDALANGTPRGGTGGSGGGPGRIIVFDMTAGTVVETTNGLLTAVAGTGPTLLTGGIGGTGRTTQASL